MPPKMAGTSAPVTCRAPGSRAARQGHAPPAGASSSRVTKQRPISLGSWRKLLWRPEGRCPLSDRPGCGAPGATVGRRVRPGGRAVGRSGGLKRPAPALLPSPGPCARPMGTSPRPPDKVTAGSTCGGRSLSVHARAPVRRRAPLARIHSDTATRALEGDAGGERRPGVSRGQGTAALAPSGHSRAGPSRCRLHRYTRRRMSRSQTGLRPDSGTHHTEQTQNPQLRPDSGAQRAEWSQNSAPPSHQCCALAHACAPPNTEAPTVQTGPREAGLAWRRQVTGWSRPLRQCTELTRKGSVLLCSGTCPCALVSAPGAVKDRTTTPPPHPRR